MKAKLKKNKRKLIFLRDGFPKGLHTSDDSPNRVCRGEKREEAFYYASPLQLRLYYASPTLACPLGPSGELAPPAMAEEIWRHKMH